MPKLPDPASVERPWIASYPPGVPPSYTYPDVPLSRFLDDAARDFPEHIATYFEGETLTWVEVSERADRLATALSGLGVGKGTPVGVVLPNLPANLIATFAVFRLGAVLVQCDPRLTETELRHQLGDSRCEVVITLTTLVDTVAGVRSDLASLRHTIVTSPSDWLPRTRRVLFPLVGRRTGQFRKITPDDDVLEWERLISDAAPFTRQAEVVADDLALIQYTGGTTGVSRGVALTHGNLVANSFQARLWVPDIQAGKERVLAVMPFAHAYGFTLGMLTAVLSAGSMILVPEFDVQRTLQLIDRTKPTLFPAVPAVYKALTEAEDVADHDLSSIRACVSGAAPLPDDVALRFEELTRGARLREGYGLSEAGPLTHANPIYGRHRPGTVGLPVTDTVSLVVDPDDPERILPLGEPGELLVAGPQVMHSYHDDPEGTAAALLPSDGGRDWLRTGDIAEVDADGYVRLVDRIKDIIHSGGHNLYPRDIEEVLLRHPGVAAAAVVGEADPELGESVTAYVVTKERAQLSPAELEVHCKQRLAAYKVPRRIELRPELPRTRIGKLLRRELRTGVHGNNGDADVPSSEEGSR